MILPIRDVLSLEKSKATRFGHHGLVVIVKGHEELFFEFSNEERRTAFANLIEHQMEDIRKRLAAGDVQIQSPGKREALILQEFVTQTSQDSEAEPSQNDMGDSLPAIMFTSDSSTFLTFKPKESLRFTFLTIGSRGDVQPYIALAKGLLEDGHRVKIATHGEYKEWIESVRISTDFFDLCLCDLRSMESTMATLVETLPNLCEFVLKTAHSQFPF
jgi:sterol 3beta-glucosyltransferase